MISIFFAAGAGAWIYTKFYSKAGGNSNSVIWGTVIASVVVFFVIFSLLRWGFHVE